VSARETEGSALLAVTVALGLIAGACDGLSYLTLDGLFVVAAFTMLLALLTARMKLPAPDHQPTPSAPSQP